MRGTPSHESVRMRLLEQLDNRGARKSVAGLALILGIDRFTSEARTLTNRVGHGVTTRVVAKWTGNLAIKRLQQGLDPPCCRNRRIRKPFWIGR